MTEISMTDATPAAQTANSGVEAELVFTAANRPPEVTLSFDGLNEPTGLFADLHGMGWSVPPVPPRPSNAIEWVPDPTTGQDFTIRNWRVKEFRLAQGSWWTAEQAGTIGASTIEALKRHGANIVGLRGEPLAAAQPAAAPATPPVDPAAAAAAAAGQPAPATPAPAPAEGATRVIALDPSGAEISGCEMFSGVSGRQRTTCAWGESAHDAATLFPTAADFADLSGRGGQAWSIPAGTERPTPSSGSLALVQMIVPNASASDSKVAKLAKLMGKDAVLIPLEPIHGGDEAVLFCATVAANSVEMLTSNLRLRSPQGIVRS